MNVLFVCIGNAGRSQMSEALFRQAAGGRHEAHSAGSDPAGEVHPNVVEALRELDIDISTRVPHRLGLADVEWADLVVTMGCGDACPVIPGKRYLDWNLEDPKNMDLEQTRGVRDEVAKRIEALLSELEGAGGE
jgi:arsenate reductase